MLEKRMKIVTYGAEVARSTERFNERSIASDVVAELWMLPIERFSNNDAKLFRQVYRYVRYSYGLAELPDWYQAGDIPGEW